jgi:hypothetical protein
MEIMDEQFSGLQQQAGSSEAAAAAVAAEAAEVSRVGRVGGPGAVSLSPVLSVVQAGRPLVTASRLLCRQSTSVGRGTPVRSRAGRPPSLPARQAGIVGVHLRLEEVQQGHGQFQIGALIAMDRVAPPAVVQAVHQAAHLAVLLAGKQVPCKQKLGVPPVQSGGQLLVEGLEVGEQLLAGLHRRIVVATDIRAVAHILATRLQEVAGEDREDEDPPVAAGGDDPLQFV